MSVFSLRTSFIFNRRESFLALPLVILLKRYRELWWEFQKGSCVASLGKSRKFSVKHRLNLSIFKLKS